MSKRRFIVKNARKKRMYLSLLLACILLIGIGYSNLSSNLNITGTLGISKYDHTLYGIFEKAAEDRTYARNFVGEHQDSFAGTGTKEIYHWYGQNDTQGNYIQNLNNVIFANHCWKMIRTTDTGGVKLMYNGEVDGGKCLDTRGNHAAPTTPTSIVLNDNNYYYGTDYTYDSSTDRFSLSGVVFKEKLSSSTRSLIAGKYTCKSTNNNDTCYPLYMVEDGNIDASNNTDVSAFYSTSHYSQYGFSRFDESVSGVGYMHNVDYPTNTNQYQYTVASSGNWNINGTYYYSDTIDYNVSNANSYTLTNPVLISDLDDKMNLVGKYVLPTSGTYNSTARYVLKVNGNYLYYRELKNGDLDIAMTIGDSYTESGGVYTLTNPSLVSFIDWYSGTYSNYKAKYACDGNNTSCSTLKHITTATTQRSYDYFSTANSYLFAEDVTYNNGTYTLTGDIKTVWDFSNGANQTILANHHYTCHSMGTTCTSVNYVYYVSSTIYFLNIENVANIEAAINKMLYDDNVNANDSDIKRIVDSWYAKFMGPYDEYVEDTIFCNDRTIRDYGGWGNNGSLLSGLLFRENTLSKDITCSRTTDSFSTENSYARLKYKVGLATAQELNLLNNRKVYASGKEYYTMTPYSFLTTRPNMYYVSTSGSFSNNNSLYGVRPVISLAPGVEYADGDGSMTNPYTIEVDVNTLSLDSESVSLVIGNTVTPTVTTSLTGKTVTWSSDNPSVATVNSSGVITAVSKGQAIITASIGALSDQLLVKVSTQFEADSWETIIQNVQNDNTSNYHVGDTKEIELGNGLGTHTVRIANTSTPAECSTTGFSQTACGFVLEFVDIITEHRMNPYKSGDSNLDGSTINGTGNKGGWEYSDMRAYLNSIIYANENIDYSTTGIYSSLPEVLRNAIINTTVVSGRGSVDTTNYTTTDKLYLLSTHEVWEDGYVYDTAYSKTRQLDYYANLGVTGSNYSGTIKQINGTETEYMWWLRSASSTYTSNFYVVSGFGYSGRNVAHVTCGVSPAFRIG